MTTYAPEVDEGRPGGAELLDRIAASPVDAMWRFRGAGTAEDFTYVRVITKEEYDAA